MNNQVYARIRQSSKYFNQDNGTPFPISLNTDPSQLADGFYIEGGPGGNYTPEDLDLYVKKEDKLIAVKRKSWVK